MEAPLTSWDDAMALLPIAHKYCMEPIESSALGRIKQEKKSKYQLIDVICISKKLDMFHLFAAALCELWKAPELVYFEDSEKLGPVATHMIATRYATDCLGCGKRSPAVCQHCKQKRRVIRPISQLPIRETNWRI
ncbi:hypothetical protein FRC18_004912 [Serendipita sp. 400]|nr:hypothetical protein FRC18_004912 [Serendipita sp. 400]